MTGKGKAIIWDWNGTLLDDVSICIEGINLLLRDRKLPELDHFKYREIFTFPVREYYEKAGFDFRNEPFDIPALQFIEFYKDRVRFARLFPDAMEILEHFSSKGYRQSILSAMEQDFLCMSVRDMDILGYFDHVRGIDNHFADSKASQARKLLRAMNAKPEDTTIVGDTIHDFEIAVEVGCKVILVAQGHQSASRLGSLNCDMVNHLRELKEHL